jgi:putative phosphoesterase
MKLAVLSDSHDNIWKLDQAIPHLSRADAVVHCGDLCSPFMIKRLAEGAENRPVHVVWGNNDGDQFRINRVAKGYEHVHLHGDLAALDLEGVKVAVNHYPEIARGLAASGEYDLVCFGHNHTQGQERVGDCLLLNPGELMGMKGVSTIAIVDLQTLKATIVEL